MKSKHVTLLSAFLVVALFIAGARFAYAANSAQAASCAETYTVVSGDTLGALAQKYLGSNSLYQKIADATNAANKTDSSYAAIANPNTLEVGWKLCIPAKAEGATTATAAPAQAPGAAAGLYTQVGPAADASNLVFLITLDPNGGMVTTMSYIGKNNIVANGSWQQTGDTVTLKFAQDNGQPSTAVAVFKAEGDKLTTTQDDNKQFGDVGFVAAKVAANVAELSGVWNVNVKSESSNERLVALTLLPNGEAEYYQNVTNNDGVFKIGAWQSDGKQVTVKLDKQADGAAEKTIDETLVFNVQEGKLVAVEYDKAIAADGLTLAHVQNIGAIVAPAPAATTTPAAPTTPTATTTPAVTPLTLAQLGNATYQVQDAPGGTITLKDGKAEVEVAPGSASKYTAQIAEPLANGAINGKAYAAAVLITSGGGSGTFYNLAVVPNNNGQPGTGLTALLGDRVKVEAITFDNNTVKVNYLDRKADEAMTTEPSVPVTKYYTINAAGALVETQAPAPTTSGTTSAPAVGAGFAGTWLASSPAADASALLRTMELAQDGTAALSNNYVGKGIVSATGTWEQTAENTANVTFTKSDDRNINDAFTFQLNGDTLTATHYDQGVYGGNPPTLYRATNVVTGTVSYLQRIALPDNAVVEVYLVDVTDANAPAKYLSGVSFTTHGKQVPLEFAVPYAGSQIQASAKYVVQAFISADGKLLFKNSNGVAVLTNGAPTSGVEIVVEPPAQ